MATKHRKLFPTSTTNQTVDCPDFCDPTCPDGCYPYPYPDTYFLPPPPPAASTSRGQHLSPYVIIVVSLLAACFLVVSFYVIIVKYCSRWNRFRPPPTQSEGTGEEFLDENHGPAIDHHIWYIATVGLQPSVINSITVFRYKKGDSLIEGTECSVCLTEFQDDETLRLLPKCSHAFHIPCIDTWLRSHTNCPLCRAGIVSNTVTTPPASNDQISNSLSPNEDSQMENSESDGESDDIQDLDGEIIENRAGTGGEVELPQIDHDERKNTEHSKASVYPNGNGTFWAVGDSDHDNLLTEDEIDMQPMRRSVSVDSSTAANIGLVVANFRMIESEGSSVDPRVDVQNIDIVKPGDRNLRLFSMMGGSSIAQTLQKSPVSMKRSFSHGGRSFLSRHYRSPNSILPL